MPDPNITITNNAGNEEDGIQSPPAFLDLADSVARLGSNMSDADRVELQRLEMMHERQRAVQLKNFEDERRALELRQAHERLGLPLDPNSVNGGNPVAASAPTTPPRLNVNLTDPSKTMTSNADKRKSVTYAPSVNLSPDLPSGGQSLRSAGAKSMPASRRTSASEHDDDIAAHLQNLSMVGERPMKESPMIPPAAASRLAQARYNENFPGGFSAGRLLDKELESEMQSTAFTAPISRKPMPLKAAINNLPTSDEEKFHFAGKVSSAALDLAHRSQTSPRSSFSRTHDPRESSEWPQFTDTSMSSKASNRRSINGHEIGYSSHPAVSLSATPPAPLLSQHSNTPNQSAASLLPGSRRSSPPGMLEGLTRSVPATPLGVVNSVLKTPSGTPLTAEGMTTRMPSSASLPSVETTSQNTLDLQSSLSRLPSNFENYGNSFDDSLHISNQLALGSYSPYATNGTSGSTALYHHNGTRYGLGVGRNSVGESKMNGLHGAKHKRGDMDLNRFAGTRLEDLQGEIPMLCKDQHGCRYLQKKLEEGVPEHRDMIFRETFGHFADLMTDPFGNYLCQKLLEYSTDEQRNIICESVAKDLVTISLNMHGTRAVQKMIDFLSTRRQSDPRYHAQISSIIVALSMHVVVLIKDLNGNHVIQKCLNKLAPEDNQFIYNAVAANCNEVATHRHGCCVLQRCIDHASEAQRLQLVNEITYNALTLVQDPYGNYVVQYILDLNDNRFSDAIIRQFSGNICALSVQKFSSNVIEKCVRVAEHNTRKMLIDELLNRSRLEKLLKDSYGNYCVQTALDYAEPGQRALLVEGIRPVLPLIRNTPYGKRIQNKLQREHVDHFGSSGGSGYHHQQQQALVNMGMGSPAMSHPPAHPSAGRHMLAGAPLPDVYGGQNLYSLPSQGSYAQGLHGMHPSIDGYVLQGNGAHPSALSAQYSGASYNPFGGANLGDPYQRPATFSYNM